MFVCSLYTQYLTILSYSFINSHVARDTKHVIDSLLYTRLNYKILETLLQLYRRYSLLELICIAYD